MTRFSLGEEKPCGRCKKTIPPGEISALVADHWLCDGCLILWQAIRAQSLKEALAKFMESK